MLHLQKSPYIQVSPSETVRE